MSLNAEQREALRLELLLKANEREKWINEHYSKLYADLEQARTRVRDCNMYSDLPDWERRRITVGAWDARQVARTVFDDGTLIRHELDIRASWQGEPCRRISDAEEATAKIERSLAARPPFLRQWQTERDLLRDLARDVEMGRLGRMTAAQAEERLGSDGANVKGES